MTDVKSLYYFTGRPKSEIVADKLNPILTCPLCTKFLRNPKLLPCGHTFCKGCLITLVEGPDKECRLCKENVNLKADDIEKLPSNHVIEEIIRVNKKYELWSLHGTPMRECEICREKRFAIVSCLNCKKDMCKQCNSCHSNIPEAENHVTLEITDENERMIAVRKAKVFCKQHDFLRIVSHFCLQCQEMKCEKCHEDCAQINHELIDLTEYASGLREELGQCLEDSKFELDVCNDRLRSISEKGQILSENENVSLQGIHELRVDLMAVVKECSEQMCKTVKNKYEKRKRELDLERNDIQSEKTKTLTLINDLDVVYQWGSDAHLVMEFENLKTRIDSVDTMKYHRLQDSAELGVTLEKNVEAIKHFSGVCLEQFEQNLVSTGNRRLSLQHPAGAESINTVYVNHSFDSQTRQEADDGGVDTLMVESMSDLSLSTRCDQRAKMQSLNPTAKQVTQGSKDGGVSDMSHEKDDVSTRTSQRQEGLLPNPPELGSILLLLSIDYILTLSVNYCYNVYINLVECSRELLS